MVRFVYSAKCIAQSINCKIISKLMFSPFGFLFSGFRLPCGHSCASACHFIDVEHINEYKTCHKTCDKIICEQNHRCPKICHYGEDCDKCNAMMRKLRTECQHEVVVSCSFNPSLAYCNYPCEKYRSCGHKCKNFCSEICAVKSCTEKIQVESPCGHIVNVNCYDAKDMASLLIACRRPCSVQLKCNHLCTGSCGQCKLGRLHIR